MRRALSCVIVAACGGGTGIALEVTGPSETDTVELFIGNVLVQKTDDNGAMCSSEMPDLCAVRPADPLDSTKRGGFELGHGWVGMAMKSTRSTATNGVFGFSLEPDSETYIPALLVVGLDGNETPTGYALVHDLSVDSSPELMKIKLSPAQNITPATPNVDRVQVWRRFGDDARAQSACAVLEKADRAIEWFVPADDTDCDNALPKDPVAAECPASDWTYCGRSAANLAAASCAVPVTNTGNLASCRWAGPECIDQASQCGSGSSCAATEQVACFPPEVCAQVGSGCNTFDTNDLAYCVPRALNTLTGASSAVPWLNCTYYMQSTTTPCNGKWPTVPTLNLAVLTQNTPCQTLELAKFGPLGQPVTFGDKVSPNAATDLEIRAVAGCTNSEFQLTINSTVTGLEGDALLGIITTDSKRRYVRVHDDVLFGGGCGSDSYCQWKGPQSAYSFTCD